MSEQSYGMLIGGLLPAIFYGISGVFAKPATEAGIGIGPYVIIIGLSVTVVGVAVYCFSADHSISLRSGLLTSAVGITWAIGAAGVAIALANYNVAITKLVPLYNMNTLVAVVLGLVVFSEWKDVQTYKLVSGAVLIAIGGSLVATS